MTVAKRWAPEKFSTGEPLQDHLVHDREPWMGQANCRGLDTELFFPPKRENTPYDREDPEIIAEWETWVKEYGDGRLKDRSFESWARWKRRQISTERSYITNALKRVCDRCPVVQECLNYALENGHTSGTWGGMSAYHRRPLHTQWNQAHPDKRHTTYGDRIVTRKESA